MNDPPVKRKGPTGVDAPNRDQSDLLNYETAKEGLQFPGVNPPACSLRQVSEARADGTPEGASCTASGPWGSPHTGRLLQKSAQTYELQRDLFLVQIFPSGIQLTSAKHPFKVPPEVSRGLIEMFSDEAARRLREWFMTMYVPGFALWKATLTTHGIYSDDQWRSITMRFRQALKYRGWAGIWRVELQRRKAPHLHVAFWLPPGVDADLIEQLWLKATREEGDPAAWNHAVLAQRIDQDDGGWAVYMGLHDGKSKAAQLGWIGKQWGIWNRELFVKREPEKLTIDTRQRDCLLRVLRKLDVSKRMALSRAANERTAAALPTADALTRSKLVSAMQSVARRPREPRMHRGNMLRLMNGPVGSIICKAIISGQIYPQKP